ncbi:MAG TPA: DUF4831 family protein [Paludibacteraceae bacterium]|nr:DUF4831 family protein [Paludibacteraceae bacterium]HQB69320.1 DUF4831 family protein [Paludibacteraceae bacterium]
MKKKVIIWVALWSSITMLSAQTSVNLVQEDDVCSDGIMYKLPLTTLVLQADVVQVIEKQGPFYKYTERFLGMTDFITESKTDWQLQGVRVFYRTEPDNTKCYHIAINKKTTAFNVELDSKGVIRTINQRTHTKPNRSKKSEPVAVDTVIRFDFAQLGEEALVSSSIPKMAEMAAKQIYHIRESRTNLLSGDNEELPDGVSLTLMLQKLDETEAELMALFIGKRIAVPVSRKFYVTPREALSNQVVFRMSAVAGIVESDNLLGRPVYLSVKPSMVTDPALIINSKKMCGPYYNVPGSAEVVVADGTKVLAEKTITMPQFGVVACLPALLFDGVYTKVEFTDFGTIKSISK